jgi:hypothetical protein
MKKWLISIFSIVGMVVISITWWFLQSPVSSGIYLEKHTGSEVIEIEENETMMEFSLPVQWVKSHPWEKPPVLNDVVLRDQHGEVIASIQGEYPLSIDERDNDWKARMAPGTIELYINGERTPMDGGFSITSISDSLQNEYLLNQLHLSFKGEELVFSMDNSFKLLPTEKKGANLRHRWEVQTLRPLHDEQDETQGLIIRLEGPADSVLEEILFWLSGMSEDYFENHVLYSFDGNIDENMDEKYKFEGETLTLPLTLTSEELTLFLPYTPSILAEIEHSIVHLGPFILISDKDHQEYYSGGMRTRGPYDHNWEGYLIEPQEASSSLKEN